MCPRVSVFEGQPATIHLQGYQTPQGQASLQMLMSVTKQGKGARLALAVTEASADEGDESHLRSHTETTQVQCNVPFGKPYKMELKKDSDGSVGAWMEVTVTEVEREQCHSQTACGGGCSGACPASMARAAEEADATPLDTVGEVVDCLYDILSDTATSAFGWAIGADEDEEEAPQTYLQAPPQTMPSYPSARICVPASRADGGTLLDLWHGVLLQGGMWLRPVRRGRGGQEADLAHPHRRQALPHLRGSESRGQVLEGVGRRGYREERPPHPGRRRSRRVGRRFDAIHGRQDRPRAGRPGNPDRRLIHDPVLATVRGVVSPRSPSGRGETTPPNRLFNTFAIAVAAPHGSRPPSGSARWGRASPP